MHTTLTNGSHVSITREQGRGGEVIAIRTLSRNPITGEVFPAALAAAVYVEDMTTDLLSSLGVQDSDLAAVTAL